MTLVFRKRVFLFTLVRRTMRHKMRQRPIHNLAEVVEADVSSLKDHHPENEAVTA